MAILVGIDDVTCKTCGLPLIGLPLESAASGVCGLCAPPRTVWPTPTSIAWLYFIAAVAIALVLVVFVLLVLGT